ncbi:P1 family peptidase [Acidobacteriota bacterium]
MMNRRMFIKNSLSGFPLLASSVLFEESRGNFLDSEVVSLEQGQRARARELGIIIGDLSPGPLNAITDVEGVKVGQTTIIEDQGEHAVRTGLTVICPHKGQHVSEKLFAAFFSLNGWGEMTGIGPIEDRGWMETPIFLTGTYNVGIVYSAAVDYLTKMNTGQENGRIPVPVVAECFDDFLSDTQSRQIAKKDVFKAIESATGGPVEEGSVGGGTGMTTFGFKGGIGTSSRVVRIGSDSYTVGVLVMANTASRNQLRIDGVPVGKEIQGFGYTEGKTKSIILIAATTAPLLPYQLKKITKRVAMGLAQTGAISQTGSGDIVLAFSTGNRLNLKRNQAFSKIKAVNDFWITPIYQGAVEATQEAIINALTSARTIVGQNGNTAHGIPLDQVMGIMKKYHRLKD